MSAMNERFTEILETLATARKLTLKERDEFFYATALWHQIDDVVISINKAIVNIIDLGIVDPFKAQEMYAEPNRVTMDMILEK